MANCSNHPKDIAGITDMKVLAEMIGDLHYETLEELLAQLANKLHVDAKKDLQAGRTELSDKLFDACYSMAQCETFISEAWKICKPFMNEEQTHE
jgi:hypothetical protein